MNDLLASYSHILILVTTRNREDLDPMTDEKFPHTIAPDLLCTVRAIQSKKKPLQKKVER